MKSTNKILIEGFSESEILEWSKSKEFQDIVFSGEPIIFKIGTSEILGQFSIAESRLNITLSHILGGGEGVLIKLMIIIRQFAKINEYNEIQWTVHAVDCPKPNPKLPRILELKNFKIIQDPIDGSVYRKIENI